MLKKLAALAFLFICTPVLTATSPRGGAELLNPKGHAINSSVRIFNTSGFYDDEGVETTLTDGDKYRLIDVDFSLSYGVSKNLEFIGFGRFRNISSTLNETTNTKSAPESIGAEVKFAFAPLGLARYALGVHYRQSLYSENSYSELIQLPTDELILGDSGSEYGVDFFMTYLGKSIKWDGVIGYSSPANELSDEINYKLEGIYQVNNLGLLAGIEGISSLKKDTYTKAPTAKPFQATGATHLFNGLNREIVAPYIGAKYVLKNFLIGVKGQATMSGRSTDKGTALMLSLGWTSEGVTSESVKVNSFKEYQVDGSVLKISVRGNFLRIDQGLSTDVEKGMKFDVYQTDYFGGNELVASGVVFDIGADWSIIKLTKKYKEIEIKPGFAARGY